MLKRCSICEREKPLDGFYVKATGVLGVTRQCKECFRARARANYAKNAELLRPKSKARMQRLRASRMDAVG